MVSSISFCRTIFLLSHVFYPTVRRLFYVSCHVRGQILHISVFLSLFLTQCSCCLILSLAYGRQHSLSQCTFKFRCLLSVIRMLEYSFFSENHVFYLHRISSKIVLLHCLENPVV